MGRVRVGILGTNAGPPGRSGGPGDILGGGDPPGVLGVDDPVALDDDIQRIIAKVTQDWDPPSPRTPPPIVVGGATHNLDITIK